MVEHQIVIFLKPDALSGPYAHAHAADIHDFFSCLAAALNNIPFHQEGELRCSSSPLAAKKAFRQITERALSEEAFSIPLKQKDACKERLLLYAQSYKNSHEFYSTKLVIQQALQAFGFSLMLERYSTLVEKDIEMIYADDITERPSLKPLLFAYLAHQVVCLMLLSGLQEISALQIVKTYARYFLRYRDGEQNRLENLVHVPDAHDAGYLLQLCLL